MEYFLKNFNSFLNILILIEDGYGLVTNVYNSDNNIFYSPGDVHAINL
jgi:hypothetical protein